MNRLANSSLSMLLALAVGVTPAYAGNTLKLNVSGLKVTGTGPSDPGETPETPATGDGTLRIAPSSLSFGQQLEGTTSTAQRLTVTNNRQAAVTLAVSVTPRTDFGQDNSCGGTLGAGASCTVDVAFTPSIAGARSASVAVTDGTSVATAGLSGIGVAPGRAELSAQALVFDDTEVGSSRSLGVQLTNAGGTVFYATAAPSISGSGAGHFSLESNTCSTARTDIHPGLSCSTQVRFTPLEAGQHSATLTFPTSLGSKVVTLSASSQSAAGSLTADGLSFQEVLLGTTVTRTFSFKNVGSTVLNDIAVTLTGSGLTLASNGCGSAASPGTLVAGASCSVNVSFTPTQVGTAGPAQLVVASSARNGPSQLTLNASGKGLASPTVSPSEGAFGEVEVGSSKTLSFQLGNSGTAVLYATAVPTLGASSSSQFAVTSNSCSTQRTDIYPGLSCDVVVRFTPATPGHATGSLNIPTSSGVQTVLLSASGKAAPVPDGGLLLSNPALSFGSQEQGSSSAPQTVTVTNKRPFTVSLAISVDPRTDFGQNNTCGFPLAAGASCAVSVSFTPSAQGSLTASLIVSDGDVFSATSLSGTGIPAPVASLSPTQLDFGDTDVGTSKSLTAELSNSGGSVLYASGVPSISGPQAAQFTIDSNTCSTARTNLSSGLSCATTVRFSPTGTGVQTAILSFPTSLGTKTVALSGIGQRAQGLLTADALSYADVPLGSSVTRVFSYKNTGTKVLTGVSASLTGTDFALVSNTCGVANAAVSLPVDGTCSLSVKFAPSQAGAVSGAGISVASSATNSPSKIDFVASGKGVAVPTTSATPSTFASTEVGSSRTVSIALGNSGTAVLYATAAPTLKSGSSSYFTMESTTCSVQRTDIHPGLTCDTVVRFTPQTAGTVSGTLQIPTSEGTQEVPLSATAVLGSNVLTVTSATYGYNRGVAAGNLTAALTSTSVCGGKVSCSFNPAAMIADPAPGSVKYLTVNYSCTVAGVSNAYTYTYDRQEAGGITHKLSCSGIVVTSATWGGNAGGATSNFTSAVQQPAPTACGGAGSTCSFVPTTIKPSFDPAAGKVKYLTVNYSCLSSTAVTTKTYSYTSGEAGGVTHSLSCP